MTDEEIEKQAEKYFCEHCENGFEHDKGWCSNCSKWDYFIAGAKWGIANAIEWHDLREDPNDLPVINSLVLNECGDKVMYLGEGKWVTYSEYYERDIETESPLAWCELPQFKE